MKSVSDNECRGAEADFPAKRLAGALIKLVVSVFLLWWVAQSVDGIALLEAILSVPPGYLLAALAVTLLQTLLLAWRWHRVVAVLGGRLGFARAASLTFLGLFANQALPTSVGGDIIRVWGLHRLGTAPGLSVSSVFAERAIGFVVLGLLVSACTMMTFPHLGPDPLRPALLWVGPCLLAGTFLLVATQNLPLSWLPDAVHRQIRALISALTKLAARPVNLIEVAVLGATASLTGVLAAYIIGIGLGIELDFPAYVALMGAAVLFAILPISIGGWGVREAAIVVLFKTVEVALEDALALSIIFGVLPLIVSLPAGLAWRRFFAGPQSELPKSSG